MITWVYVEILYKALIHFMMAGSNKLVEIKFFPWSFTNSIIIGSANQIHTCNSNIRFFTLYLDLLFFVIDGESFNWIAWQNTMTIYECRIANLSSTFSNTPQFKPYGVNISRNLSDPIHREYSTIMLYQFRTIITKALHIPELIVLYATGNILNNMVVIGHKGRSLLISLAHTIINFDICCYQHLWTRKK